MNIGGIAIGGDAPCRFVFEVSNAHNGDETLAHLLVDGAADAGADFVKFQAYTPDELIALRGDGPAPDPWGTQGWTMRALYERARTPLDWLPALFAHARDVGLVPFSSVFGLTSLAACEAVDSPAYKIAALDNEHDALRSAVTRTEKPVLVSARREQRGRYGARWPMATERLAYLLCPAGYPQTAASFALEHWDFRGETLEPDFLGLSSHCLAPELPIAAVARGCKLIEMHGMLDAVPSALEANVSLTVTQFRHMIDAVRRTEEMLG